MDILASLLRSVGSVLGLGFLLACLFPVAAMATTAYVDDDGPGACTCATKLVPPGTPDPTCGATNKPFSCIQDALNVSTNPDTIIVRDGVYNERPGVNRGGASDTQRLTIMAEHTHGALVSSTRGTSNAALYIHAKYVTVQGLRITGGSYGIYIDGEERTDGTVPTTYGLGIVLQDTEVFGNGLGIEIRRTCENVRLTGVDVHDNAPQDGIDLDTVINSTTTYTIFDTIIENSHVHHNHNQGIGTGYGLNTIVRNSEIDHNGTSGEQHGFYVKDVSGLIQGNKIHHNSGFGVQLWAAPKETASKHYIVERNEIFENGSGGVVLGGSFAEANQPVNDGFPHYVEIRNNFIHHNAGGFTFYGGGCDPSLDPSNDNAFHHNTVYNNSTSLQISAIQNTPTMRLLLKDNIFVGPSSAAMLVLLQSTNLSANDIDGNIYYAPPPADSSTQLFHWQCYGCNLPDDLYSFDDIRSPGIVQNNTPRPDLLCNPSVTTVGMDQQSRWTDPMVVDPSTSSWSNAIGASMGDYHLRQSSPAISGGVCCTATNTAGGDFDGEDVGGLCFPANCHTNSAVTVGADIYYDSNRDGVADRNECSPSNGTVCDCNTTNASNCTAEIPDIPASQELPPAANCYLGAPYDYAVHPGATEQCDGKDNDCNGAFYSGGESDADGDGYFACSPDCNDSDPNVNPGAIESPATLESCFDGVDNDCDNVADLDCAIDAVPGSQVFVKGSIFSGSQANLGSTTLNDTYEVLQEEKKLGNYTLGVVWTFSTTAIPSGTDYDLRVDGFRNAVLNDQFNFSASIKQNPSTLCTTADGGSTTLVSITDIPPDPNKLQVANAGIALDQFCVKLWDSNPANDTAPQNRVTLDRVYLFPAPIAVADYPGCQAAPCLSDSGTVSLAGYLPFELTQRSDNIPEVVTESNATGVYRLSHTWQFKSVPAGTGHVLHFEGYRASCPPDNSCPLDDFKFYYATSTTGWSDTDPTAGFTLISGATINTTTDPSGGVNSSAFGGTGSGTYYIRVIDAQNSGSGTSQNTLSVDHLTIRTNP